MSTSDKELLLSDLAGQRRSWEGVKEALNRCRSKALLIESLAESFKEAGLIDVIAADDKCESRLRRELAEVFLVSF